MDEVSIGNSITGSCFVVRASVKVGVDMAAQGGANPYSPLFFPDKDSRINGPILLETSNQVPEPADAIHCPLSSSPWGKLQSHLMLPVHPRYLGGEGS